MRKFRLKRGKYGHFMEVYHFGWIAVEGEALSTLQGIIDQTGRLATMGDNERRSLWVEYPGKGRRIHWLQITTQKMYDSFISLTISDGRFARFSFRKDTDRCGILELPPFIGEILKDLLSDITEVIDGILEDPGAYNRHVDERLPKRLRVGRIPRRTLEAIVPDLKLDITDPKLTREALETVRDGKTPTLRTMTIREFCHWFRVAYQAFIKYNDDEGIDDLEFYMRHCLNNGQFLSAIIHDPDSEKGYRRFAKGHYGEIGLSKCGVLGHRCRDGWMIEVYADNYAYLKDILNMIGALYKAGAPLHVHDPGRLLAVIDKTDMLAIRPKTYHDYMSYDDTGCGGSLSLSKEEELCPGEENGWTPERLEAVIAATEWEPLQEVAPENELTNDDKS